MNGRPMPLLTPAMMPQMVARISVPR